MLYCSSYFIQSFNLVRLYIALSLVVYSYYYIETRELKKYTIFVLLAASFHYSAIIVWPLYFLWGKDIFKIKNVIIFGLIFMFSLLLTFNLENMFTGFFSNSKYAAYATQVSKQHGIGLYIIKLPLIIVGFIYRRILIKKDKANQLYLSILIVDFLITPLSYAVNIIGRVSVIQVNIFSSKFTQLKENINKKC